MQRQVLNRILRVPIFSRRIAATRIYNAGNTLKLTADILGHKFLDSTVFYAKTDIKKLAAVAKPWSREQCHAE
jgi:hypothetical protein